MQQAILQVLAKLNMAMNVQMSRVEPNVKVNQICMKIKTRKKTKQWFKRA